MSSAATCPSLMIRGGSTVTSTTVDPTPPIRVPASRIRSSCPATCGSRSCARWQPVRPDKLALVPVMGLLTCLTRAEAVGCPGRRTPILPLSAVSSTASILRALKTSVTRPGQKASIMASAAGGICVTRDSSRLRVSISTRIGLWPGRCFI